ncbi:MAG: RuBisCO large subunit C-terminal-like domain-containing protein [Verrucomicrobiota bacterium]
MTDPIRITYHLQVPADQAEARAEALLLEQTVELPRAAVRHHLARQLIGEVVSLQPLPDQPDVQEVVLEQPLAAAGTNTAQLLNVIFGNCSLQPDVALHDVELPEAAARFLPGPALGIKGLRQLLRAEDRAMTMTALKPMGQSPGELAELAATFALVGIDVIKDDHGLATQDFCPFEERVALCQEAVREANDRTGHRCLYVPNICGSLMEMLSQMSFAAEHGVRAILIEPMVTGLPMLAELATAGPRLAILAHPSFGGATRIAPELMNGKLFRWYGADATIFPNYGGRFSYSQEQCRRLAQAVREPLTGYKPAMPVPAGGIAFDELDPVLEFYGRDTILLMGGSLYEAGENLADRAGEFAARTRAKFA